MSFLKIKDPSKKQRSDPSKGDALVAEYLNTKNKIQNDFRSERLGEQANYGDFSKLFKPVIEQQQKSSEKIVSQFAPLQTTIENFSELPQALPEAEPEGAVQPKALPEPPLPISIESRV